MSRQEAIQNEKNILEPIFNWKKSKKKIYLTEFFNQILKEDIDLNKLDDLSLKLENSISKIMNDNEKLGFLMEFSTELEVISSDFMSLENHSKKYNIFYKNLNKFFEKNNQDFKEKIITKFKNKESFFQNIAVSIAIKIQLTACLIKALIEGATSYNSNKRDKDSLSNKDISKIKESFQALIETATKQNINHCSSEELINQFESISAPTHSTLYDSSEFEDIPISDNKNEDKGIKEKKNKIIELFENLKQKWLSLPLPWKIAAGAGFFLGTGIIITTSIFLPPSLAVTIPVVGKVAISTLTVTAGTAVAASSIAGHAIHVSTQTPPSKKIEEKPKKIKKISSEIGNQSFENTQQQKIQPNYVEKSTSTLSTHRNTLFNETGKNEVEKKPKRRSNNLKNLCLLNCLRIKFQRRSNKISKKDKHHKPILS